MLKGITFEYVKKDIYKYLYLMHGVCRDGLVAGVYGMYELTPLRRPPH